MRPDPVVAMHQVVADITLSRLCCYVTSRRNPFRLCGTTAPSARYPSSCLGDSCSVPSDIATTAAGTDGWRIGRPDRNEIAPAAVASLFVGHVQHLDDQLRIRLGGKRPAGHSPCMQIQHYRQVMPATLCPDVGDIAAPHLIGALGGGGSVVNSRFSWFGISGRSTVPCL